MLGPHALAFLWNPASLSYFAELVLALFLALFAWARIARRRGASEVDQAGAYLGLVFACLGGSILSSLLRAQAGGFYASYAMPWAPETSLAALLMPWSPVFGALALLAFVQFAYLFPVALPGARVERRIAAWVMLGFVAIEIGLALAADWSGAHRRIWFRPSLVSVWQGAAAAWAAVIFLRQFRAAQRASGQAVWTRFFARGLPRDAAASRAYTLLMLLPLLHVGGLVLKGHGELRQLPLDAFSCWSVLALLAGLSLIHVSYQAEQSSFMLKMVAASLAMILGTICGFGWVISPAYQAVFRPSGMVEVGQTLRFSPDEKGGYAMARSRFALKPATGAPIDPASGRVALPFRLPFYGRTYDTLFVSEDGAVGFERKPHWPEMAFGYGGQPLVAPLAIDLGSERRAARPPERVIARAEADRVVISWLGFPEAAHPDRRYSFQLVLYATGVIEMSYLELPPRATYRLFYPLSAPWFVGLTPGGAATIHWMDLGDGLTAHAAPGQALIQDYYLGFLGHLDHLYAPIAILMLVAAAVVALSLPLFFRVNLLNPLRRLLDGVQAFHQGDFQVQVSVTYNDEIGYLTRSFNAMASSLNGLVNDLEAKVTERVEEIGHFTARNALLEERNRLAAELHDSVSQTLTSAALLADTLPGQWGGDPEQSGVTIERIRSLTRNALEEIRLLMTDLYANRLASQPLGPALIELEQEFAKAYGLAIEADIRGDAKLPSDVQAMVYRVAQESLSNIARHARAKRVWLTFEALPGQAMLKVADDGRGFDPAAVSPARLGLQVMSYRARHAGGSLDIQSRPGGGTTVTLVWFADHEH